MEIWEEYADVWEALVAGDALMYWDDRPAYTLQAVTADTGEACQYEVAARTVADGTVVAVYGQSLQKAALQRLTEDQCLELFRHLLQGWMLRLRDATCPRCAAREAAAGQSGAEGAP
jgi:hypothetical protein